MPKAINPSIPAPLRLELHAKNGFWGRQRLAAQDVAAACSLVRLILTLGWLDIRLRYRGSLLGPFWLTLSTTVMIAALGFVYSTLFHQELHDYLPFLALSLVLWNATSSLVTEACTVFTAAEASIRAVRLPFTVYAARLIVRQLLVLLHNVVVIAAVYLIFNVRPGLTALLAVPGFAIWLVDGMACCLLLGVFCARFRDIPQIVSSIMQIAFFVTPIVWKPEQMREGSQFLPLNPFYTSLEIMRGPLLGTTPPAAIWLSALLYSGALWIAAWLVFARVRGRLAFWV